MLLSPFLWIPPCGYAPFIYPSTCRWALGLLTVLDFKLKMLWTSACKSFFFFIEYAFISLGWIPRSRTAAPYSRHVCKFLNNLHSIFYKWLKVLWYMRMIENFYNWSLLKMIVGLYLIEIWPQQKEKSRVLTFIYIFSKISIAFVIFHLILMFVCILFNLFSF